jgi:CO dehydrogenase/acetyl-CoA synthase beta subunit
VDIFDDTIKEIRYWFRQKEAEGHTRHHAVPTPVETASSPTINRVQKNPNVILREDTHLELGHPSVGSCAATLATHDSSLVEDGCISLVGPDVSEMEGQRIPFAQIAIACCEGDIKDTSMMMDRQLHRSAQSDGYMIRSVPHLIWARVSKQAARSGFSMFELGSRLIKSLRYECQGITGAEILFVTTSKDDISSLEGIVEVARAKLRKLLSFKLGDDDTYECTTSLDCDECSEQPVCNSVRDVIKLRKGDRIITFGKDDGDKTT